MIAFLEGETAGADENRLFLNVNGVGFGVFMPVRTLSSINPNGAAVKIYTHMAVREDALTLYGFLNRDDKKVFQLLLGVSGIGPKGALAVLSALSADELRFAVVSEDVKTIASVPGLGKKTAQKLILELKDKLDLGEVLPAAGEAAVSFAEEGAAREAVAALRTLGYTATEAAKAVGHVAGAEALTVEVILKEALRYIGG